MNLAVYDPFRGVRTLQNEINRLFERDLLEDGSAGLSEWGIRVDIKEDTNQVVLRADLPGMELKEIKVHVENGILSISGERRFGKEEKREDYHRIERSYGRFNRAFSLPASTDATAIRASYKNGVLEVVLPKHEQAKPRQIEVAVEG